MYFLSAEEMKNFARQWVDPTMNISGLLLVTIVHIAVTVGVVLGVVTTWISGLVLAAVSIALTFTFLFILWTCSKRLEISKKVIVSGFWCITLTCPFVQVFSSLVGNSVNFM